MEGKWNSDNVCLSHEKSNLRKNIQFLSIDEKSLLPAQHQKNDLDCNQCRRTMAEYADVDTRYHGGNLNEESLLVISIRKGANTRPSACWCKGPTWFPEPSKNGFIGTALLGVTSCASRWSSLNCAEKAFSSHCNRMVDTTESLLILTHLIENQSCIETKTMTNKICFPLFLKPVLWDNLSPTIKARAFSKALIVFTVKPSLSRWMTQTQRRSLLAKANASSYHLEVLWKKNTTKARG